jgi:hypothetical protein
MISFTSHDFVGLATPRDLTADEKSILAALIGSYGSEAGRCQLARTRVVAVCAEGCGSIVLNASADSCGPIDIESGLVASAEWHDAEMLVQNVMLFSANGVLGHLETYREDGKTPAGLPPAEELTMLTPPRRGP